MKKLLLTLLLLFTLGLAAQAGTVTFKMSGNKTASSVTGTDATTGLTVTADKGTGSAPTIYTTDAGNYTQHRFSNGNTLSFSISDSFEITEIAFEATSASYGVKTTTASCENGTVSDGVVTFATPVTSTVINVLGNLRLKSITVTYQETTSAPTECPVPVFSVADGANVYPGSVISVDKKGATTCELYLGEEKLEGDSYIVPETAEIGSTITLTAKSTLENGNPDNASATITVTVAEAPLEALFDFVNEANTTYKNWPSGAVTNTNQNETVTINGVTLHATGRLTVYSNDLRLYAEKGSSGYGSINISVPDGYYLTNIEIDGSSLDKIEYEAFTNTDITVREKTYTHVTTTGTVTIKTINVKYAKIPDPTLDGAPTIEVKHGPFGGVLTVNCDFYIKNYNNNNTVEVVATVDGMPEVVFAKVETPNAPARAAAESTRYTTTLKATHENLKGATPTVNVAATIDGKNLFTVAKGAGDIITTGIEDVTVEVEGEAEYYNLQGLRVAQPEAGQLYIKRQGGKAVKVRF